MKKKYINPEIAIVMLQYSQLLASSPGEKIDENPDEWGAPALDLDNNMFGF